MFELLKIIDMGTRLMSVMIAGYFNIDLIKVRTHTHTNALFNILLAYSYTPAVNIPTRITEFSFTLIDNIYIRCNIPVVIAKVIYWDISDHLPIIVHIEAGTGTKGPKSK